jgi:hypothetical protein
MVTGEYSLRKAGDVRDYESQCGKSAKWFEPKDEK